ncbi:MAG TPA: hypothetical protein VK689_16935 [Armatimonadota bacterium]|nr:hypothetical protein [Armatimonadota bacterium]
MLGWSIYIYRQDLIKEPQAVWPRERGQTASWLAGWGGLDWLDALVEKGDATYLGGDGYPLKYTALAANVLPLIARGPPKHDAPLVIGDDYIMPGGWTGEFKVFRWRVMRCPSDTLLQIHAWDQS